MLIAYTRRIHCTSTLNCLCLHYLYVVSIFGRDQIRKEISVSSHVCWKITATNNVRLCVCKCQLVNGESFVNSSLTRDYSPKFNIQQSNVNEDENRNFGEFCFISFCVSSRTVRRYLMHASALRTKQTFPFNPHQFWNRFNKQTIHISFLMCLL